MAPKARIIRNVQDIPGTQTEGPGSYADLVASTDDAEKPITAGVWYLDDVTEPLEGLIGEWDEVKYILAGELLLKDEVTGEHMTAKAGDFLWLPTGANSTIVSSKGLKTLYVEQRHADWPKQPNAFKDKLQAGLDKMIESYKEKNPKSAAAFEEATKVLPGGNTRTVLHQNPFPLVMESGKGTNVTSRDGTEYLDFVSEYSAAIYGHSHPKIHEAINQAMTKGINLGSVIGIEAQFASGIQKRFPSMELMRFTNSGTEATTLTVAAALAYTGRKKVLVFNNGYHGSTMSFAGFSKSHLTLPHDFVIGTYNNIQATWPLISSEIGAIVVEPLQFAGGVISATCEFLQFLRDGATAHGCVLVFDEIVTSRFDYHGLQGYWGIKPDMTTLGKYLGGGFSFGCFGGKHEIMEQFDPRTDGAFVHSGTYNNNVFTMMAGIAGMQLITSNEISRINALGNRTRESMNEIIKELGLEDVTAVGFGSAVGLHVEGDMKILIKDTIYFHLLEQRIVIARRGFMMFNIIHEAEHVDQFLTAFKKAVQAIVVYQL